MNYNFKPLTNELEKLSITLSEKQIEQFTKYYEMLVEKNKVMNLTAITEFDEVLEKHFLDSVSLIRAKDLHESLTVLDLGTGAGFPGIPLKIVFPELKVTLADSLNNIWKKVGKCNINCDTYKNIENAKFKITNYEKLGNKVFVFIKGIAYKI